MAPPTARPPGRSRPRSRVPARPVAVPIAAVVAVAIAVSVMVAVPATPWSAPARPAAALAPVAALDVDPDGQESFERIAAHEELTADHATLFRLYWAFFDRSPDPGGALYWIGERDRCVGLETIAQTFAASPEFAHRYGRLDDAAFVERVYGNVLGRASDPAGAAYWRGLLADETLTRGGMVLNVAAAPEFTTRHRYPSDGVPSRSCRRPDGRAVDRSVHVVDDDGTSALTRVAGITLSAPAAVIERAGFHESTHPGALAQEPAPGPVRLTTMATRNRGTDPRGAVDIVVAPDAVITAPVSGTVARAGAYTLYCRYRDGFVVINPDGRPDLEVKILHVQGVSVRAGQRVEAGQSIADHATTFPFRSQIDALTAEPSWPHVHIEVVDPSVPRRPSSGRGC